MHFSLKSTHTIALLLLLAVAQVQLKAQPGDRGFNLYYLKPSPDGEARLDTLFRESNRFLGAHRDSALYYLEAAKRLSIRIGYPDGLANAIMKQAFVLVNNGEDALADSLLETAAPFRVYAQNPQWVRMIWHKTKGALYTFRDKTDSSIIHYRYALKMAAQLKDTASLIMLYSDLGSVWATNGQITNAKDYLNKGAALARKLPHSTHRVGLHLNLAYAHSMGTQTDTAQMRQHADTALRLAKENNDQRGERQAHLILGNYCMIKNTYRDAADHFALALDLSEKNSSFRQIEPLKNMAVAWYYLKDYPRALRYAEQAYALITNTELRKPFIGFLATMAEMYHKQGQSGKAYEYQRLYSTLQDSVRGMDRIAKVDELEARFRAADREKEIALKENQLLEQRDSIRSKNIWIAVVSTGIIGALTFVVLLYTLYKSSKRNLYILRQQKQIDELKAMNHGEEQERSRIAITLHDHIGGLLSATTYNLNKMQEDHDALTHDPSFRKIEALISEIRHDIRSTAHHLMPDVLLRHGLKEAVQQYCADMERPDLQLDVQVRGNFEDITQDFQLTLYRIIQELVQNVIKHAKATRAFVQLYHIDGIISLTVEDNGIGFDPDSLHDKGMGISNIRNRIVLQNGRMSINSASGDGTSIYIEFDSKVPA